MKRLIASIAFAAVTGAFVLGISSADAATGSPEPPQVEASHHPAVESRNVAGCETQIRNPQLPGGFCVWDLYCTPGLSFFQGKWNMWRKCRVIRVCERHPIAVVPEDALPLRWG